MSDLPMPTPDNQAARARQDAERSSELVRLMQASRCRQSARARATGRALQAPESVDGLALFDAHRSPGLPL